MSNKWISITTENKWTNVTSGIVFLAIAAAASAFGLPIVIFSGLGGIDNMIIPVLVVLPTIIFFLYAGFKNLLKGGKEVIAPEPAVPEAALAPASNKAKNILVAFLISYVLSFALPAYLYGNSPDQSIFRGMFLAPIFIASIFAYAYILNRSMSLQDKVVRIIITAIVMLAISYLPQIMGLYILGIPL